MVEGGWVGLYLNCHSSLYLVAFLSVFVAFIIKECVKMITLNENELDNEMKVVFLMPKINYMTAWFASLQKMQLERKPIDYAVVSYLVTQFNALAWTTDELIVNVTTIRRFTGARYDKDVVNSLKRLHKDGIVRLQKILGDIPSKDNLHLTWVANVERTQKTCK